MDETSGKPKCAVDPETADVIAEEFDYLGLKSPHGNRIEGEYSCDADAEGPIALCLSGGGIRSATFSLGVLQGLAQRGRLKDFHYLSTVSGGGYIGAWLSAWIRRTNFSTVNDALKDSASGLPEAEPIRWLRCYSNFLAPVRGLSSDSLALVAIFARNLALHWIALIPILALVLLIPRIILSCNKLHISLFDGMQPEWVAIVEIPIILLALWLIATLILGICGRWFSEASLEKWGRRSGWLLTISVGWFILSIIVIKLPIWILELEILRSDVAAAAASIGGAILAIGSAVAGYWSKQGPMIEEKAKRISDLFGITVLEIASLVSMLIILLAITLSTSFAISEIGSPFVADKKPEHFACETAIPLVLDLAKNTSGTSKLACSRYRKICGDIESNGTNFWLNSACPPDNGNEAQTDGDGALASVGEKSKNAQVMIGSDGDILISAGRSTNGASTGLGLAHDQSLSQTSDSNKSPGKRILLKDLNLPESVALDIAYQHRASLANPFNEVVTAFGILLVIALFSSFIFIGNAVNIFSLGIMYGNRLTRAYLGASNITKSTKLLRLRFNEKDDKSLHNGIHKQENKLFHVINAALNLTKPSEDRLEWQQRKAASFVMTPLQCGSAVTGYVPTNRYKTDKNGISFGKAIAISGAAVSPSMGYHSSIFVSMLLTFFNIRLGFWAPTPGKKSKKILGIRMPLLGILCIYQELTSRINADSPFVYLSDGGHFENLGLYEMIRRRCKKIIVVDAGHDPDYLYEDLENAIRKVRTDFGAQIIPYKRLLTPEVARETQQHHLMARIIYPEVDGKKAEEGSILLLKPVLSGDEPFDLLRYAKTTRKKSRVFPQQPTSDQFFDESQFESYRALGLHSIQAALKGRDDWPKPDAIMFEGPEIMLPVVIDGDTSAPPPWAPPDDNKSISQSFFQNLSASGQSALLASTIGITGAIGLSGTVALMNNTVKLDQDSIRLLESIDRSNSIHLDTDTQKKIDSLIAQQKELIEKLSKISAEGKIPVGNDAQQLEIIQQLTRTSIALADVTGNTAEISKQLATLINDSKPTDKQDLSDIIKKLDQVIDIIKKPAPLSSSVKIDPEQIKGITDALQVINESITKLNSRIDRNGPSRNISGGG
jgi:hypothetical protein